MAIFNSYVSLPEGMYSFFSPAESDHLGHAWRALGPAWQDGHGGNSMKFRAIWQWPMVSKPPPKKKHNFSKILPKYDMIKLTCSIFEGCYGCCSAHESWKKCVDCHVFEKECITMWIPHACDGVLSLGGICRLASPHSARSGPESQATSGFEATKRGDLDQELTLVL